MKTTKLLLFFTLGIILTLAILYAGFFFIYGKATEKQLASYGDMTLNGSALYVDTMMESTKDLLDNIYLDPDVSMLLNYETVTANSLLTGLRRLYKYTSSSYFIDSIYIFNRKNKTVYVSSPHMPEAVYEISSFPDFGAAEILNDYTKLKNMEPMFRIFNAYYPIVSEVPYISFIRYNALSKANESNVIMVNIRQDILSDLIRPEKTESEGLLLVADSDCRFEVISGDEGLLSEDLKHEIRSLLCENKDKAIVKIGGQKYIVSTSPVLSGHAKLVLLSEESFIDSVTQTKDYGNTIILIGLLFIVCLIITGFIFRHIWLFNQAQLQSLKNSEEEKKKMVEAGKRGRILAFLHSGSSLEDIPEYMTFEKLVLAVFAIDHYTTDVSQKFEKASERNTLKEGICRRFASLLKNEKVLFFAHEDDERCVFCVEESASPEIEKAKSIIEAEFGITFTAIVARPCTVDQLPDSYEELCFYLPYRLLKGYGAYLTSKMLEEQETIQYTIPEPSLKRLAEEILRLNTSQALQVLSSILDEISLCSYRSAQQNLMSLYIVLDDSITKLQMNNGIGKATRSETLIYRLYRLESIKESCGIIESLMHTAEQALAQGKNNRQTELVAQITAITREHFARKDFSINTVAGELSMSSAYLGKVFKKSTGMTFNEFVLSERMSVARGLLADSDETIDEIVFSVGFSDTPYFYKLFKKINGCTPTRFRQEHRQHSEKTIQESGKTKKY